METSVTKFLWKYAKNLKIFIGGLIFIIILSNFLISYRNYLYSEVIRYITDFPRSETLLIEVLWLAVFIFVVLVSQSLSESAKTYLDARFMPYYIGKISKDLFICAHKHSVSFFAEEMAGNVSGKIRTIITNTERAYMHLIYGLVGPISNILIILFFIFGINIQLGIIFSLLNITFIMLMIWLKKKITLTSEMRAKMNSESNGILVDSIANSDLVKNFGNLDFEKQVYFKSVKKAVRAIRTETKTIFKVDMASKLIFDFMNFLYYLIIIAYWYKANLTVANIVLLISFINMISNSVRNIGFFATDFSQLVGGIRDGLKLLNHPCEVEDKAKASPLIVTNGDIEFNNLQYHYKTSSPLFSKFNLKIKSGEKVGIVGHSGSGKSTLIKLLSRYYDIQDGSITIDNINIKDVTQKSLHKNIALIPQDPSLFNRTILENIRYGNPYASDEEVIDAAQKAYIHDFILTLPQGYNSKVGERGVMLSGGERQRIAIARAILKNAPILILDEATSALDSESEKYIQESILGLMHGKTVIAIAHRLSTLKEMDRIVVMEKGKIIEQGSPQYLIHKKGLYYKFYQLQSSGFIRIED